MSCPRFPQHPVVATPPPLRIPVSHHPPSPKGLRPPHRHCRVPRTSQHPCSTQGFQTPIHSKFWGSQPLLNSRGPSPFPPLKGPSPCSLPPAPRSTHSAPSTQDSQPLPHPSNTQESQGSQPLLLNFGVPAPPYPPHHPKGPSHPNPSEPRGQAPSHPLRVLALPQPPSTQGSPTLPTSSRVPIPPHWLITQRS